MRVLFALTLVATVLTLSPARDDTKYDKTVPAAEKDYPPGWFPITKLTADETWQGVRDADKEEPKVRLYLPPGVKACRGVFLCFQFHSADPRHCADLWDFALVTVPWPMEYDIGVNDKRSGRVKLGHPAGNTGYLLRYLEFAAKETNHPELATAPIVGWLMQNGAAHVKDLYDRAPDRLIAWSDGWPNRMAAISAVTDKVPFVYAWELGGDVKEREAARAAAGDSLKNKPTPAPTLTCRATTYGFKHGVYSKYGFFACYLDRCIKARLPADGKPGPLLPVSVDSGWASDFNPVTEWVPIAPAKEARGMVSPVWLPDEYMAWVYRAYHSAKPDLKVVAPVTEYRTGKDRDDCGLGYSPIAKAGGAVKVVAAVKGEYKSVEFRDGDKVLGSVAAAPYELDGVKFAPGLHALIAVGVRADGTRASSHPAFYAVK
ncbi:Uncharacterized protein OS=Pirellula staleyi (strain ATCC 27377 / DSM 6068 / ICPB 4128) GN=Psta_0304 PE=4 SV=1 [Gemmataceae bacterium]|nr:Uncharacterized protein OS=Pirellula staleyi (strain ATCC 27377 / DSM 6068 / ICPB 4128) GN=Psta_0304 PE=4 SV=1 [Gemmataceae bacterium]VTU02059.1 Uncharacterized protein OS=Pirellula staleyi (strain ATCC 27377 / DSM 6068 / ICPB 4128) GN=Psta_0304 PE=4 SV=1 [Gemmataceae bacterium]